jgi:hypothetical protein
MRIFSITVSSLVVFMLFLTAPVIAQDNAAEIASLQSQIARLQNIMSLGVQELDRVGGQGAQGFAQQITNYEAQLANIDAQIVKLDDAISNATEQQRTALTQSLNNLLRQKAGAEAYLVQLKLKYDNALSDLNLEKSKFTGKYNQSIDTLNKQLDELIQVNCCIDGACTQKSRSECVRSGGTEVTDCAQQCSKINCCKGGTVTSTSREQCSASGGNEVNYPSYECEIYKCKTKSGECVDSTRGECEKNGGVAGRKTECPQ